MIKNAQEIYAKIRTLSTDFNEKSEIEVSIFTQIALNPSLYFERYQLLCLVLKTVISQSQVNSCQALILECYLYHIILDKVYRNYIGVMNDVNAKTLSRQKEFILQAKEKLPDAFKTNLSRFVEPVNPISTHYSYTYPIRHWTQRLNICRLALLRSLRFMITLNEITSFENLDWWMLTIFPFIRAAMNVINFIYFIPRVLFNLVILLKHVFIFGEVANEERSLQMSQRFLIHWYRRWDILFRDSLWMTNGILNLFVLTGNLATWGLLINSLVQFFEFILNLRIYWQFINQKKVNLAELKTYYLLDPELNTLKQTCFDKCQEKLNIEENNHYIRMRNSGIILLSTVLAWTVFSAVSVYLPFLGSILGLIMTIVQLQNTRSAIGFQSESLPLAQKNK